MKSGLQPLIDSESSILILGTMPGEKSIELQQYYGNGGNRFWKLIFEVFEKPFSLDYEERKMMLQQHNIALWSVIKSCQRAGSSDIKIKCEIPNNFTLFHKTYPKITHVFFESKAAAAYYDKYIGRSSALQYVILPSTSGLYAVKSFDQKLEEWKVLSQVQIL